MVTVHLAWFDPSSRIKRFGTWIALATGFSVVVATWFDQLFRLLGINNILHALKFGLIAVIVIYAITVTYAALSRRFELTAKIRLGLGRLPAFFTGTIVGIIVILLFILLDSVVVRGGAFMRNYGGLPLNTLQISGFGLALGKFILVHFWFTWLLTFLAGVLYLIDKNKAKYLGAPLIYSLLVLIISWPILSLADLGSAEIYITNVAMFIALPYLLTTISDLFNDGVASRIAKGFWPPQLLY